MTQLLTALLPRLTSQAKGSFESNKLASSLIYLRLEALLTCMYSTVPTTRLLVSLHAGLIRLGHVLPSYLPVYILYTPIYT